MAPVDLEAFSGDGFHADEGPAGRSLRADVANVLSEDAVTAVVSHAAELLLNNRGGDGRVLFDPLRDGRLEGIEFAGALSMSGVLSGRIKVLPDRSPADVELPLDFADGPVLGPVRPMQVVDLFGGQHAARLFRYAAESANKPAGCCLQDGSGRAVRGGSASITQTCA